MVQCMLAGKYVPEKIEKLLPVYGDIKYDGIRGFVHEGYAKTRSLKPVRSSQVQSIVAHNREMLWGLDFEMIVGEPTAPNCYNRTDSSVMSFDKPDEELKFYVFDHWDSVDAYEDRRNYLESIRWSLENDLKGDAKGRFIINESKLLWSIEDVEAYRDEMISLGHEGIMLRNPKSPYKFGRGTPTQGELIKIKDGRWIETEARITGYKELMSNQNEATINVLGKTERSGHKENLIPMGVLGAFEGEGIFPDEPTLASHLVGKKFETSVGGGFSAEQRIDLWNQRDQYVGKIMRFKFFTGGIKDKPRFTGFLGFRDPDTMEPEQLSLF